MAYFVSVTARAQRDLARIYEYIIATDSPAALKWYQDLTSAIMSLEEHPTRWPVTHESNKLRHILYGTKPHIYRIVYCILERRKRVEVIHIRQGARGDFL